MIGRWFKLRRARQALAAQDPSKRKAGLEMISDLDDPQLADLVTKMAVADPDMDCLMAARERVLKHKTPRVVSALRHHLLMSWELGTRRCAAEILGSIGGQDAMHALARGVEDFTFRQAQELCVRALGKIRDPAVIPMLKKIADDAFWYPSRKKRVGGSGIDIGYDERAVAREDARVREAALEALASIGGDEVIAIIRRHIKDYDVLVRGTAERLLKQLETPQA